MVSLTAGKDLLLVSWRAADEDVEDAHPSSHHVQVGRRPVKHLETKTTLIEINSKTSGKDPQRQTKEEELNDSELILQTENFMLVPLQPAELCWASAGRAAAGLMSEFIITV